MKLKSFYKAKNTVNRTKWNPAVRKEIFTNPTSDRGLILKIYKELKELDTNKPNNPIKKWNTELHGSKTLNSTCWRGFGARGTFLHCW